MIQVCNTSLLNRRVPGTKVHGPCFALFLVAFQLNICTIGLSSQSEDVCVYNFLLHINLLTCKLHGFIPGGLSKRKKVVYETHQ